MILGSSAMLVLILIAIAVGGWTSLRFVKRAITAPLRWYYVLQVKREELRAARARAQEAEEAARNEALRPLFREESPRKPGSEERG